MENTLGLTFIVCTYNGRDRIEPTLQHLAAQDWRGSWEVLIVDNASTDGTAEAVRDLWPRSDIPLRAVFEPRPGLINARKRGIQEAAHEIVCFVDDDNWLESTWASTAMRLMATESGVGACGGSATAVFDSKPPAWFGPFQPLLALGEQGRSSGAVPESRGWLWGAGIVIRRAALLSLYDAGFCSLLTGRTGKSLSTGEDVELCMALRLTGWNLWFDDDLRMYHYIPTERTKWGYLWRLARANGEASVWIDTYQAALALGKSKNESMNWRALVTSTASDAIGAAVRMFLGPNMASRRWAALRFQRAFWRLTMLARSRSDFEPTVAALLRLRVKPQ